MKLLIFRTFASEKQSSLMSQHFWCFALQAALVLGLVVVIPSAAEKTIARARTRGPPAPGPESTPMLSAELEQPGFFLRQLELLDKLRVGTDLKEAIRHQRQIKFKSSYGALPVALRLAEEQRNSGGLGKSLDEGGDDDEVQVIFDDSSSSSRESSALKDLPPSSEIYFSPEVRPRKGSRRKNLDQENPTSHSLTQNNPFRFRTKLPESKPHTFSFKKQGKLVRKKMVGKKLLKSGPPKPQKIEQALIKFQLSSTENIENKVKNKHQSSRGDPVQPSVTRINGGPNHEENFKNPFYVETPPNAVSSYSVVPENSIVNSSKRGKSLDQQHKSATPKPSRLSHTKPNTRTPQQKPRQQIAKQQSSVKKIHASTRRFKPLMPTVTVRKNPVARRITKKKVVSNGKHSQEGLQSWNHFLGAPFVQEKQRTPILKPRSSAESNKHKKNRSTSSATSLVGNQKSLSTFRRGKTLSGNLLPMLQKMAPSKSGYPNLVRVPKTNFRCGSYTGGEYFADEETNCQVFHVCFGGRQASFVCPVGTAFSQQLLVCDWWHKVQCGGEVTRPQRSLKPGDHPWHLLNAYAAVDPMVVKESVNTNFGATQATHTLASRKNLTTEAPTETSSLETNSSLPNFEYHDESLGDNFKNTTTELVGLSVSTNNGTFINITETPGVITTDPSPHDVESDV